MILFLTRVQCFHTNRYSSGGRTRFGSDHYFIRSDSSSFKVGCRLLESAAMGLCRSWMEFQK
jgi:hypothetical protein